MFARTFTRSIAALALFVAPLAAQSTLGGYAPSAAKYRITVGQNTSQIMMGQTQEFEASSNELVSVNLAKSGSALTLTITIDSATASTNAPMGAPNPAEAIGLKVAAEMALDGKIATSQMTDKSGAPSSSQFANSLRQLLPRLRVGAVKGDTWADSTTSQIKIGDADIKTETVVNYMLTGDTVVAGVKAWIITGTGVTNLSGRGSQQGADYTISGPSKGTITAIVSAAGVLLGETTVSDSNLSVNVEAAGMTIPVVQHGTVKVEKLP
jgi:hypothetical protein